jgi:hypothetical protein
MSKSNKQSWILLTVLLVIFVLINYFAFSLNPRQYPQYVSDSPSPTGVKAIYAYLNQEMKSKRWSGPPEHLPKINRNQLLVMVEPTIPDKKEMKAYLNFLKAGNTILLLKTNPKGMFDLETEQRKVPKSKTINVYDLNKKAYKAEINSTVRLIKKTGDQSLLNDKAGSLALKRTFGKGNLIVSLCPNWMTNDQLLKRDHLTLVLKLIGEGHPNTVLFDEYLHGNQSSSNHLMVYPQWFLLMNLQGIFLFILWLWYKGKRFGPISIPREESVRFSDEGIRALSAWYLRGNLYHDSITIQADYVRSLLQERWGIPHSKDWLDLVSWFERKLVQLPTIEIRPLLTGLTQVLEKEKISKQEYLLWSRNLDRLRKEVEQG